MSAGFIIGGRMLPNANVGPAIPMGMEPGVLHGYVSGSVGLPTIGATVMAVQQGDDFYASAFVSVNGQYYMNLQPGEYIVYVAFPDGSSKVVASELQIERGAADQLDISY
jgi:Carboxypeptidase regulatory-like domain